jgi:hypothetical protein
MNDEYERGAFSDLPEMVSTTRSGIGFLLGNSIKDHTIDILMVATAVIYPNAQNCPSQIDFMKSES